MDKLTRYVIVLNVIWTLRCNPLSDTEKCIVLPSLTNSTVIFYRALLLPPPLLPHRAPRKRPRDVTMLSRDVTWQLSWQLLVGPVFARVCAARYPGSHGLVEMVTGPRLLNFHRILLLLDSPSSLLLPFPLVSVKSSLLFSEFCVKMASRYSVIN